MVAEVPGVKVVASRIVAGVSDGALCYQGLLLKNAV
jgi:hypothetical protein